MNNTRSAEKLMHGQEARQVPTLAGRLLVVLCEAYVNRKQEVTEGYLAYLLNEQPSVIAETLSLLERDSVVRRAKDHSWKHKRQTSQQR